MNLILNSKVIFCDVPTIATQVNICQSMSGYSKKQ